MTLEAAGSHADVQRLCRLAGLPRATYYRHLRFEPPGASPAVRSAPAREEPRAPAVAGPRVAPRPAEPAPVPFDAALGSILYSPDRKLAIVNGRIVAPGDEVNGARIVDITSSTVLLRDAQGRLRSLTLAAAPPSSSR